MVVVMVAVCIFKRRGKIDHPAISSNFKKDEILQLHSMCQGHLSIVIPTTPTSTLDNIRYSLLTY